MAMRSQMVPRVAMVTNRSMKKDVAAEEGDADEVDTGIMGATTEFFRRSTASIAELTMSMSPLRTMGLDSTEDEPEGCGDGAQKLDPVTESMTRPKTTRRKKRRSAAPRPISRITSNSKSSKIRRSRSSRYSASARRSASRGKRRRVCAPSHPMVCCQDGTLWAS